MHKVSERAKRALRNVPDIYSNKDVKHLLANINDDGFVASSPLVESNLVLLEAIAARVPTDVPTAITAVHGILRYLVEQSGTAKIVTNRSCEEGHRPMRIDQIVVEKPVHFDTAGVLINAALLKFISMQIQKDGDT
jgi:hypothetical protein